MPLGAISNSDSDSLDVPLPALPSSQPSSVTTQHPTAAKSKSNSSLSSESVFVGNMENTADLSLESHTITNVTQTSRVKHGLIREGDQAAINTPQMSDVLKKIASVAQKQNMDGNMENTAESGVNSNIHVPNFSHSTQVYSTEVYTRFKVLKIIKMVDFHVKSARHVYSEAAMILKCICGNIQMRNFTNVLTARTGQNIMQP